MRQIIFFRITVSALLFYLFFLACKSHEKKGSNTIATSPKDLQRKISAELKNTLADAIAGNGVMSDSLKLYQPLISQKLYEQNNFEPFWCHEEKWTKQGNAMLAFVKQVRLNGLFPEDYHTYQISSIEDRFLADSIGKSDRRNVNLWSKADILITNAFVRAINEIKIGRLPNDSVSLRTDSVLSYEFIAEQLALIKQSGSMNEIISKIEPHHPAYQQLKNSLKKFIDSASFKDFVKVPQRGSNKTAFNRALQKRLFEEGFITSDSVQLDSVQLSTAVKKFQLKKGIAVDGKVGEGTLRMLNLNDKEKFIRIALSMDKYKLLPQQMPEKYVWVNLPSYKLELFENGKPKVVSNMICGKPYTRTPLLNSQISELITYPQWVPPPSIVQKEILPAVKKNPGYLARKGFSLINSKGEEVDPYSVDWSKYNKGIPYRVVQGSGDANSLGIMKFVFPNKYSVYLHDTNQRYLFGQAYRSLSHGCVRVQNWQALANYIIGEDKQNGGKAKVDSVASWLSKKQKRSIALKNKVPVYIRYITCEGSPNGVNFYDDIYGEDRYLAAKYFKDKQ